MTTRKPMALGNVWVSQANLYRNGKLVASCMDTPNAIAYAMKRTGATMAKDSFGGLTLRSAMEDRIATSIGGFTDKQANLKMFAGH